MAVAPCPRVPWVEPLWKQYTPMVPIRKNTVITILMPTVRGAKIVKEIETVTSRELWLCVHTYRHAGTNECVGVTRTVECQGENRQMIAFILDCRRVCRIRMLKIQQKTITISAYQPLLLTDSYEFQLIPINWNSKWFLKLELKLEFAIGIRC
jgi:hypothetical protein